MPLHQTGYGEQFYTIRLQFGGTVPISERVLEFLLVFFSVESKAHRILFTFILINQSVAQCGWHGSICSRDDSPFIYSKFPFNFVIHPHVFAIKQD